jgi:RNA polymerase sigma-70 factor (ECF subfamily)
LLAVTVSARSCVQARVTEETSCLPAAAVMAVVSAWTWAKAGLTASYQARTFCSSGGCALLAADDEGELALADDDGALALHPLPAERIGAVVLEGLDEQAESTTQAASPAAPCDSTRLLRLSIRPPVPAVGRRPPRQYRPASGNPAGQSVRLRESVRGLRYEYRTVEPALADIGERLVQGQPEALEECYRSLGPLVMSYLSRYLPQPDIEDVMQRVFYEVWRVHERYDPNLSLRGWVLGIARKRAIDHLRKRRDIVVPLDSMREITGEDGREIAERLVWADEVRTALNLLSDLQREVIELAYFGGLTQTEIAESLDVPLGTVKTRTSRGLQRMAGLLESTRERR